jgi:hypothetical protein
MDHIDALSNSAATLEVLAAHAAPLLSRGRIMDVQAGALFVGGLADSARQLHPWHGHRGVGSEPQIRQRRSFNGPL